MQDYEINGTKIKLGEIPFTKTNIMLADAVVSSSSEWILAGITLIEEAYNAGGNAEPFEDFCKSLGSLKVGKDSEFSKLLEVVIKSIL